MKVKLNEYVGCFEIDLTAETVEDAAALARMSINRTKELGYCGAYAHNDRTFGASVVIGKRKDVKAEIEQPR